MGLFERVLLLDISDDRWAYLRQSILRTKIGVQYVFLTLLSKADFVNALATIHGVMGFKNPSEVAWQEYFLQRMNTRR